MNKVSEIKTERDKQWLHFFILGWRKILEKEIVRKKIEPGKRERKRVNKVSEIKRER